MRDLVCTCLGEWPKTSMWPLVGLSRPSTSLTVVDLPDPLGPSNPKTSPRRTSKSTVSTARALGRPQKSLKTLVSPRTETTTSPSFCQCCCWGLAKTLDGIRPGRGLDLLRHPPGPHAAFGANCGASAGADGRPGLGGAASG